MKIIELHIDFEFNGQHQAICPSLIVLDNELTLVDTGYPNFLPLIENAIISCGYEMSQLKHIILTHYDIDHIGSVYDLKEKYPQIQIIASELEAKFISGERKSERLVQAEKLLEILPEEEVAYGTWFVQQLNKLKHVPVDQYVSDGDRLLNGQCKVIATPGHTSGHISLYFPELNSVITGDAAVNEHDQLAIANPQFCLDMHNAKQSLLDLVNLRADIYYCYHGGKLMINH